jgi:Uma2 family endonuclease
MTLEATQKRPRPDAALLIVDVSDSSLDLDHEKAAIYAWAKVPEYWVLNVVDRELEVYRDIVTDAASPTGFRYGTRVVLGETDVIAPLIDPTATIKVAELLP